MNSRHRVFPGVGCLVVYAHVSGSLGASRALCGPITTSPGYDKEFEILLDLRELTCEISTVGMYELATWMAPPHPALPTRRKIAIVKSDGAEFNETQFFALCARNRGLRTRVFRTIEEAGEWLDVSLNGEVDD